MTGRQKKAGVIDWRQSFGAVMAMMMAVPAMAAPPPAMPGFSAPPGDVSARLSVHSAPSTPADRAADRAPAPDTAAPISAAPVPVAFQRGPTVFVGAIVVEGGDEIPRAEFMQRLLPYIGRKLNGRELGDILALVSKVARQHGYVFAHSSVPPQSIEGGTLRIALDLGRVDRLDIHGPESPAARAILGRLIGHPLRQNDLERQLALVGDLPGMTVSHVHFARVSGQGVLSLDLAHGGHTGSATLDNRGSSPQGPLRLAVDYNIDGLAGNDRMALGMSLQMTPAEPEEQTAVGLRLSYVIDNSGTEVSLSGTANRTHLGGVFAPWDISGQGGSAELGVSHPVLRSRSASLWVGGTLDFVAQNQWQQGGLLHRDREVKLGLYTNGFMPLAGGQLRSGLGLAQTLGAPGTTTIDDPAGSRPGAGPGTTIFSGWANWQGELAGPVALRLAVAGQLSTQPLFAGDQLSIGGPLFGRAYEFGEMTGDEGVLGSAELQYHVLRQQRGPVDAMQIYGFADGGRVHNLQGAPGDGELYSAGFGGRLKMLDRLQLSLELAFPLNQPRFETNNKQPRASASLGTSF